MINSFELVVGLRDGDRSTWSQFVRSVSERVSSFARRRGHPDPDDVVGATLEAVARRIETFDGGDDDLWSFVFVVAHARVVDAWRRQDRVILADRFDERADMAPDPSVALDLVTEPEILCHLDGDHRRLVVLRYVDGWPTKDIARQVGKSDEAVRAAISRSLETLRRSDT